jgi:nucleolar protein 56
LEKLQALGINPRLSRTIEELAETSMGASLKQEDMIGVRELANLITKLEKYRENHSNYIIKITEEFAPNISTLAGPLLTAKLIENAGSLKRIAMLPSSTIQVLGAGKAMFRAIKTGAKPPKHGLLFQHPYVHGAGRKERGKRARELAGKIAIASRADYFTRNFIADQLKEQLSANKK